MKYSIKLVSKYCSISQCLPLILEDFHGPKKKSSIILEIMTHLVISKKLDLLADGTIEMILSKLV